ncbi:MAG: efflux RND transporter periplasmic adaptor subunit [Candidatus Pacebacteria bacterium]|nr:efflux RND transporter periplasmic adaptor subunit [Candidatus Paceibacterota bacterium]
MKTILNNSVAYLKGHKVASIIVAVVVLVGIYYVYGKVSASNTPTTYVLGQVTKGTITSSVSASGQIAASSELDINPKVSGQITYVGVQVGDKVTAGTVIAKIDSTDAQKTLRNAETSLTAAQIAYQKSLQQTSSGLTTSVQTKESADVALQKAYKDAYDLVANTSIDLPAATIGLNDIYYNPTHSLYFSDQSAQGNAGDTAITYKYQAGSLFDQAKTEYADVFKEYKATPITADRATLDDLIQKTYDSAVKFQAALKGTYNAIDFINIKLSSPKPTQIATDENNINAYLSKVDSDVSGLFDAMTTITNAKQSLENASTSLANSQTTLSGSSDTLDVQSAKLSLTQQQNAVQDALDQLSYYTVRAPFDGVIAKVNVIVGNNVSSGGAVATEVSPQQVATLTLNEVDAEKVKVGQKATLTFDAVPDLTLTGTVAQVDPLGTVSQGVVTYGVKITLDTQDAQVKPGMTVTASIMTDSKVDTLIVPSSAVKTQGSNSTVQVLTGFTYDPANPQVSTKEKPTSVTVQTGLSNDENVEITYGLNEGDAIVVRSISSAAAKTSASTSKTPTATSLLGGQGGGARQIRGN